MATEPVARSRVVENEEVFDGYALERSCEGEQASRTRTFARRRKNLGQTFGTVRNTKVPN